MLIDKNNMRQQHGDGGDAEMLICLSVLCSLAKQQSD